VSQPGPAEIAATSASGLGAGSAGILKIFWIPPETRRLFALAVLYSILNFPSIRSFSRTYSWVPTSERSAAKALFGEIPIHGKLPVTLPGIAKRGDGIEKEAGTPSNAMINQ
jgi:beta-N-acetylhexosaminidase